MYDRKYLEKKKGQKNNSNKGIERNSSFILGKKKDIVIFVIWKNLT